MRVPSAPPGGWPSLIVRWLVVTLGVVLLTGALVHLHRPAIPAETLTLRQVQFLEAAGDVIPSDADAWAPRALPDDWGGLVPARKSGWYRAVLTLNVPPDRLWGVYLPTVTQNVAVYLNGELLGDGGRFDDPVARNWNRPLYFSIPNGLLEPGANVLHVRLRADPVRAGLLGPIHLAPAETLRRVYEDRFFLRYTMAHLIAIMLAVIAVLMLTLWYWRRHDALYGWYALSAALWGAHTLNVAVVDIPVPTRVWEWAMWVTLLWLPITGSIFARRFLGLPHARIEKVFWGIGLVAAAITALPFGDELYRPVLRLTGVAALCIGTYGVLLLLAHFWRSARLDVLLLMMAGAFTVVLAAHDLLMLARVLDRIDGYFLHFSAPFVHAIFGTILLRRFVQALSEAETLSRTLEGRVQAKTQELAQSYEELRRVESARVLAEERARLMSDMHDGIGGQLVSTLALLERGAPDATRLRDALQGTLDDLRLIIDSMEDVEGDLLTILGMLRARLEPRLAHAGIALHWRVNEVPALDDFGPQRALQVMRIVQEALANVIKHAGAANVTVTTGVEHAPDGTPGITIALSDDGIGLPDQPGIGRGLDNMERRADKLGGRVAITRAARGTCVRLWVPTQNTAMSPASTAGRS